jgi:hypothetical protein
VIEDDEPGPLLQRAASATTMADLVEVLRGIADGSVEPSTWPSTANTLHEAQRRAAAAVAAIEGSR